MPPARKFRLVGAGLDAAKPAGQQPQLESNGPDFAGSMIACSMRLPDSSRLSRTREDMSSSWSAAARTA